MEIYWKKMTALILPRKARSIGYHARALREYRYALTTARGKYDELLIGVSLGLFIYGMYFLYQNSAVHISMLTQIFAVVNLSISLVLLCAYRREQLIRQGKAEAEFRQSNPRAHLLFPSPKK